MQMVLGLWGQGEKAMNIIEHPIGIHFGLPEAEYHADPAIGSTDIRALSRNPGAYWFNSHMNPSREPDEPTDSQIRGTAMHTLVLHGKEAFDELYECGPDQSGMTSGKKAASTREAREKAAANGRTCLRRQDYERIAIGSAMITENPELRECFDGGIPEVSVFWERDGLRCKARFDYLKARGIGDLKTVANPFDLDFRQACRAAIERHHLHEQASWYMDARLHMPTMIAKKQVYGIDGSWIYDANDMPWIKKICAANEYGWQWVFSQADKTPLTWSRALSPGSPYLEKGRAANQRGIDLYKENAEKYGTDGGMWLLIEPCEELTEDEMSISFWSR
jgi:PDDEXK-like domain of unknown function (DUF3799)